MAKINYKKEVWEAAKEPLRLLVLAVIPVAVAYFTEVSYEWAGVVILVLRFIDKYLHNVVNEKGLVRF